MFNAVQFILVILVSLTFVGCDSSETKVLNMYKESYKGGLHDLCKKDPECEAAVAINFDDCIDDDKAREMLASETKEEADKLNVIIADETMRCIFVGVEKAVLPEDKIPFIQ